MSEPLVNVITPATSVGLVTLDEAKVMLEIPSDDTTQDEKLQMLIDQMSMTLAIEANRETFAKEKVAERWDCVAPVCCPDGTCKIYLTRYPVMAADIETVETPEGALIDASGYRLEQHTGKLILIGGCATEILITYTGGYELPDEAPLPLKRAVGVRMSQARSQAAQEATSGAGIKLLAHKESRIVYFSPKDMAGAVTTGGGVSVTAADAAVRNLISKYTRYWI